MAAAAASWLPASGQERVGAGAGRLTLTLDQAVGLALKNNRGLLDAQLSRSVQAFSLEVREDRYRPTLGFQSSARTYKDRDTTADVDVATGLRIPTGGQVTLGWSKPLAGQEDPSDTVTLTFAQPLLRGFGIDIDTAPLRTARLSEKIGVLSFREAIAGAVDSTVAAWRGLVRARRQLEIAEASLERAREQRETNRILIEAGQMAAREILQSDANVANREIALIEARNGVTEANYNLIGILDIDEATVVQPVASPASRRPPPSAADALDTALRHSPGFARAQLNREIAGIGLEVARNNQLWDLSLEARASRTGGGSGETTDYSAGLRLSAQLWDRSPELELMSAKANVRRAERALAEQRQSMGIAVRRAVYDLAVGLKRIELAGQALALAERKLEIERSKLQQGLSSTVQVGRFEEDLVSAQNAEVDALLAYENALTALDRTLGTTLETWNISVEQVGR